MTSRKYEQVYDNEWNVVLMDYRHQCCFCGAVHNILRRKNKKTGKLEEKVSVNRRATAAARRKFNFPKDDDD